MTTLLETLRDLDIRHLWHPYTSTTAFEEGRYTCFDSGEGVYLYEPGGRPVLDGISSWWATALGHSHPRLVDAIREQAGILQHSILGNLSHPMAVRLASKLADITPKGLNHVYFACDGASATEAALKMAIQYWHNIGQPDRARFVSLAEGYHGDTLGAVGVGFVPQFHRCFENAVVRSYVAKAPHAPSDSGDAAEGDAVDLAFTSIEALVQKKHTKLAGVILEPLCQGAAGIRIYPAEYLRKVRALCDEHELLLIADEIAVGFGRTGSMFACDQAGIVPDILCLGKALTGGYLPMSAAIATDEIYEAFRSDETHDRTFYDGHTFCGNPITSAVALEALNIYTGEAIVESCEPLASQLREGMVEIGAYPCVAYQKSLGMIGMCAFTEKAGGAAIARAVAQAAMELGLFIRPLGEVIYLWPPLVTTSDQLEEMIDLLKDAIEQQL